MASFAKSAHSSALVEGVVFVMLLAAPLIMGFATLLGDTERKLYTFGAEEKHYEDMSTVNYLTSQAPPAKPPRPRSTRPSPRHWPALLLESALQLGDDLPQSSATSAELGDDGRRANPSPSPSPDAEGKGDSSLFAKGEQEPAMKGDRTTSGDNVDYLAGYLSNAVSNYDAFLDRSYDED